MTIGKKIQQLRKNLNLTQEQLAMAVGVSTPAVSKWESDTSYPDISLIAPIARKLETDVNDLMNFTRDLSNLEVDLRMRALKRSLDKEGYMATIDKMFMLLKAYPNNNYLKVNVANRTMLYTTTHSPDGSDSALEDLRERCEQLLLDVFSNPKSSDHPSLHNGALTSLCSSYMKHGLLEEAENLLLNLPQTGPDGRFLIQKIFYLQGRYEEARIATQQALLPTTMALFNQLNTLYLIHLKEHQVAKAKRFATDYFTLATNVSLPGIYPCELLLDLAIEEDKTEVVESYFLQYIDEVVTNRDTFKTSPYFTDVYDTMMASEFMSKSDLNPVLYDTIRLNPKYKKVMSTHAGSLAMERLKATLLIEQSDYVAL